jgi:type I restriction enzyme S subunit
MDLFHVHPGDIIVSKIDLKNGAVATVPDNWKNVVATNHFVVYEPDRSKLLPEYLQRIIQTSFFKSLLWRNKVGAEGRKEVKLDFFESLRIPLPALPTQHAILKQWDKAQREITTARHRISTLEEQIEADFLADLGLKMPVRTALPKVFAVWWKDLVRWGMQPNQLAVTGIDITRGKFSVVTGRDCLAEIKHGCSASPSPKPTTLEVLKISAVTRGELNAEQRKYMHDSQRYRREFDLKAGDVLVCRTNGTLSLVGMSALVEHDMPNLIFPDKVIRARCKSNILPAYLWKILQMPFARSQIGAAARTAVGNYAIGTEDLLNLKLPLPPLEVQQRLVAKICDRQAEILKERDRIRQVVAAIEHEIEAMILGTRPVPEFEGLQKGTA